MFETLTPTIKKEKEKEVVESVEKTPKEKLQDKVDELRLKQISITDGLREELSNIKKIDKEFVHFQMNPIESEEMSIYETKKNIAGKKEDAEKLSEVLFVMLEDVNNSLYEMQDELVEHIEEQLEKREKRNENETIKYFNSEILKSLLFENSNTDIEIAEKQRRMVGLVREMVKEGSVELDEAMDLAEERILKDI